MNRTQAGTLLAVVLLILALPAFSSATPPPWLGPTLRATPTFTPTNTPAPSPTIPPSPTLSTSPTIPPSPTLAATATPAPTATNEPSPTIPPSPASPTVPPSPTLANTATPQFTATVIPTATPAPTATVQPSPTAVNTATPQPTPTLVNTATPQSTPTPMSTPTPCSSCATRELNNLQNTAVNDHIIPASNNTKDLGTSSLLFRTGYFNLLRFPDYDGTNAQIIAAGGDPDLYVGGYSGSLVLGHSASLHIAGNFSGNDAGVFVEGSGNIYGPSAGGAVSVQGYPLVAAADSQAGQTASLVGSDATAGTTNAGAAAGGDASLIGGNAQRKTSGSANGGNANITGGSGIGTGTQGEAIVNALDLKPSTTGIDLGTTALPWRNIYLYGGSGTPGTNHMEITGTSTSGNRVFNIVDAANSYSAVNKSAVTHEFFTSFSTAGIFTSAQPAVADLSDTKTGSGNLVLATSPTITTPTISGNWTGTGIATTYNNVATAGIGVVPVYASVSLAAQAASIGATNLIASAGSLVMYRMCYSARISRAASSTSSLTVTVGWTNGGITTLTMSGAAMTGNTTSTVQSNCFNVIPDSATAITYSTTYASSGATTMQYRLHITLEELQ